MSNINGLIKLDEEFVSNNTIEIRQLFLLANGTSPTVKITSDAMLRLLNRVTTLENYIHALMTTYFIKDANGKTLTLDDFKPQ
jgi:hypothetical protein